MTGLELATVSRVDGSGRVFVEFDGRTGIADGPCVVFKGAALVVGDRVVVGFLRGRRDRPVVVAEV